MPSVLNFQLTLGAKKDSYEGIALRDDVAPFGYWADDPAVFAAWAAEDFDALRRALLPHQKSCKPPYARGWATKSAKQLQLFKNAPAGSNLFAILRDRSIVWSVLSSEPVVRLARTNGGPACVRKLLRPWEPTGYAYEKGLLDPRRDIAFWELSDREVAIFDKVHAATVVSDRSELVATVARMRRDLDFLARAINEEPRA